jgi:hypothetical protein
LRARFAIREASHRFKLCVILTRGGWMRDRTFEGWFDEPEISKP